MSAQTYELTIDGPLLRQQRLVLQLREADLLDTAKHSAEPGELEALRGLIELTDAIADQAHDKYKIDCLLLPASKAFQVASVSGNANSFGLIGHILLARDGEAYEVGRSLSATPRWKKGDCIRVHRGEDNQWHWAALGVEIPRQLPTAPAGVIQDVWGAAET